MVREAPGHVEVFLLLGDGVGIGQHLVHASVLIAQHLFHLGVAEVGRQVDGPVAEAQEECLGLFVATVEPRIAQACVHLMKIIERCPGAEIHPEVALLEGTPDALAIGHATHVALAPLRVVLRIGIGTALQLTDHILHPLTTRLAACGGIEGHRRQIVTSHVSVQTVPVGIGFGLRRQSGLFVIGCQQTVAVVLQQRLDIQVARLLQRTVRQDHIAEGELVGIQLVLCVASHRDDGQTY